MIKSSPTNAVLERGICPISFHDARKFIQTHHAYLAAPRGCLFCIAAFERFDIVAVAIVGRPVNPSSDDGVTAEISRLCTHNAPKNTASALVRRVVTATRSMGFHRVITYVDKRKDGAMWKASNFTVTAKASRKQWHGRNFCLPEFASQETVRFEFREATYASAVIAARNRESRIRERRDEWSNRNAVSGESPSAPR